MLTKDLVQVTTRNGKLFPRFCPSDDTKGSADARELCEFFSTAPGRTLGDVEDELKTLCTTPRRRALAKLLMDTCEVSEPDPTIMEMRWRVFKAAENFRVGENQDFQVFTQHVAAEFGSSSSDLGQKIFSDLPSARVLQAFSPMPTASLIELMNFAQVRTILCLAKDVQVTLKKTSTAQRREFLRQVKFQRLIADVEMDSSSNALIASLSGPLGDLCGGAAYGVRLANLIKFIASFSEWSLEASVKWKGKYLQMSLDHHSGVKSTHSRVNGSFVPPEFSQLVDAIGKEAGLKAHLGDDFLDFGAENYCFPDLIVTSEGKSFAIELFHGNHKSQIKRRLAAESRGKTTNFLMGIDRSLLKDKAIAQVVDESDWFKSYGFDFNQFPTPSVIKKVVMRHA